MIPLEPWNHGTTSFLRYHSAAKVQSRDDLSSFVRSRLARWNRFERKWFQTVEPVCRAVYSWTQHSSLDIRALVGPCVASKLGPAVKSGSGCRSHVDKRGRPPRRCAIHCQPLSFYPPSTPSAPSGRPANSASEQTAGQATSKATNKAQRSNRPTGEQQQNKQITGNKVGQQFRTPATPIEQAPAEQATKH